MRPCSLAEISMIACLAGFSHQTGHAVALVAADKCRVCPALLRVAQQLEDLFEGIHVSKGLTLTKSEIRGGPGTCVRPVWPTCIKFRRLARVYRRRAFSRA